MRKTARIYSLDILKFLAISIIIFHHYQQATSTQFETGINWFFDPQFYWGYLVELFFILSGFFSFRYVSRIPEENISFSDFFLKRYVRFLSLLIVCGAVCLIAEYLKTKVFQLGSFHFAAWNTVASLLGVARWFTTDLMVNGPMWYVSVLLLCLILFYVASRVSAYLHVFRLAPFVFLVGVGLIMQVACNEDTIVCPFFNYSIARGLICFFEGVIFASILSRMPLLRSKGVVFIVVSIIVLFAVAFALEPQWFLEQTKHPIYSLPLYYFLCFVIFPCIILLFVSNPVRDLLDRAWLKKTGDVVFNMYAWHGALLPIYVCFFEAIGFSLQNRPAMYAFLILCIAIAFVSVRYIEKPLSKFLYCVIRVKE